MPATVPESLLTIALGAIATIIVLVRVISIPDDFFFAGRGRRDLDQPRRRDRRDRRRPAAGLRRALTGGRRSQARRRRRLLRHRLERPDVGLRRRRRRAVVQRLAERDPEGEDREHERRRRAPDAARGCGGADGGAGRSRSWGVVNSSARIHVEGSVADHRDRPRPARRRRVLLDRLEHPGVGAYVGVREHRERERARRRAGAAPPGSGRAGSPRRSAWASSRQASSKRRLPSSQSRRAPSTSVLTIPQAPASPSNSAAAETAREPRRARARRGDSRAARARTRRARGGT